MNEKESKAVEFKRGDQVVLIPSNDADTTDIFKIKKLVNTKFCTHIHCESKNHYYIELSSSIRHATPAEIAAGHRIDHPCTPCPNFTNDTCCHSAAQNDFEAMDAKHCSPLCKQSGATIPNFVCAVLILLGLIICMAINARVGAV